MAGCLREAAGAAAGEQPCPAGEIKLPADYCRADLDLDAEFEVILPRRQGPGLCATALVSYLIGLHNDMVYAAQKLSEEEHR